MLNGKGRKRKLEELATGEMVEHGMGKSNAREEREEYRKEMLTEKGWV